MQVCQNNTCFVGNLESCGAATFLCTDESEPTTTPIGMVHGNLIAASIEGAFLSGARVEKCGRKEMEVFAIGDPNHIPHLNPAV